MQRNCSSAESSSANDARKTPSKHARRRTTEGETTSTTQDDAQHHREHDTIPSHNTIMPAKTQPTTDICGFSRKQDAIIINPDERSRALLNVVGAGPLARPPRSSPTPARVCLRVLRAAGRSIAGEWIPFSGAMARHSAYIRSCQCTDHECTAGPAVVVARARGSKGD